MTSRTIWFTFSHDSSRGMQQGAGRRSAKQEQKKKKKRYGGGGTMLQQLLQTTVTPSSDDNSFGRVFYYTLRDYAARKSGHHCVTRAKTSVPRKRPDKAWEEETAHGRRH